MLDFLQAGRLNTSGTIFLDIAGLMVLIMNVTTVFNSLTAASKERAVVNGGDMGVTVGSVVLIVTVERAPP